MVDQDWLCARDRALLYVRARELPVIQGVETTLEALERAQRNVARFPERSPTAETMRVLGELLGSAPDPTLREEPKPVCHPPLHRASMVPRPLQRRLGRTLPLRFSHPRRGRSASTPKGDLRAPEASPQPWEKAAFWRRMLLLLLVVLTSSVISDFLSILLLRRGSFGLEMLLVVLSTVLFAWISFGFWTSIFGYLTLRRQDRFAPSAAPDSPVLTEARIALLLPICNEGVDRALAGLLATFRSLEGTGRLEMFDFFILSDTSDPDTWIEEEAAWADLCRCLGSFDRIFYRRRRVNLKRKNGNIADFCRRWGRNYRYLVVFDADSVMTGPTLLRLLETMERNPGIGILQTAPLAINHDSLFGRLQQFANHVYGPLFTAGLHFWQLGDGQYWGHNAMIRVAPFMLYCALPRLPGHPPLGGDILSHDFVEASLMRRAGWGVWLAYDLPGSFEETPATLLEELKRDRRWCQGNLQHMRLLLTRGIFPAHRALFLNGAMSYVSALLWFLFLCASTAAAFAEALVEPNYFPQKFSLFPHWPVWRPAWALILLVTTAVILFLPKLLATLDIMLRQGRGKSFGGGGRLLLSALFEVLFSALLAPIRMLFHSKFVFLTLTGRKVGWGTASRGDRGTGWLEAIKFHGVEMALGVIWGAAMYPVNPSFFWWLTPILLALVLSVPLTVYFSRTETGGWFRRAGLFLIPEETAPPQELVWLRQRLQELREAPLPLALAWGDGFRRAVVDPAVLALHLALLRGDRKLAAPIIARRRDLRDKALHQGPDSLTAADKLALLYDPESIRLLHRAVWGLPDEDMAARWGLVPRPA